MSGVVIDLLDRPTYGMSQVDRILGLPAGTARRWIDGYDRGGRHYNPVIRAESSGQDIVTWGEFVEARLLSEYREAGIPMLRMRPAVEALRQELQTEYPLASARTWLDVHGQELVKQVQEDVGLEKQLALVVVRTGQQVLSWSRPAQEFRRSVAWSGDGRDARPTVVRPMPDIQEVEIDPLRGFGEPVVRGVRTEVIGELIRAGDSPEMVAELYGLDKKRVDAAVRYELSRAVA